MSPSEAARFFDEEFAIMSRHGLHCAPAAHRTVGRFPQDAVRFSFSYLNNLEEIDRAVENLARRHGIY